MKTKKIVEIETKDKENMKKTGEEFKQLEMEKKG